ncbi:MAG: urate oxidase [Chthoniobacterales bacterium]|nr:urate oxidase [Chthoniobacterales bacterium]
MAKLIEQRYGKAQVRVLKILREGSVHTIREIEVSALLAGDFESSYTAGDNSKVVPTDTIKNTINVLAKQHLADDLERFSALVGEHFVRRYEPVRQTTIEITERAWNRLEVGGKPHPNTFAAGSEARRFARALCRAESSELSAGVRDLVILKSTGSGFEGYPKCEYTTLPETADRILATSFRATWHFASVPAGYRAGGRLHSRRDAEGLCGKLQPLRADDLVSNGRSSLRRLRGNFPDRSRHA